MTTRIKTIRISGLLPEGLKIAPLTVLMGRGEGMVTTLRLVALCELVPWLLCHGIVFLGRKNRNTPYLPETVPDCAVGFEGQDYRAWLEVNRGEWRVIRYENTTPGYVPPFTVYLPASRIVTPCPIHLPGLEAKKQKIHDTPAPCSPLFDGWKKVIHQEDTVGQRAALPVIEAAQAITSWYEEGKIGPDSGLCVEYPELGLSPEAQVAVAKTLAHLVFKSFRVCMTTHSLLVLYTINNLIAASALEKEYPGVPQTYLRIQPEWVKGYYFGDSVTDLTEPEMGISEEELGEVGESLVIEANRIDDLRLEQSQRE